MPPQGWKQLVAGAPWFRGEGTYPILAYSEFMPPPRLGRKPYGTSDPLAFDEDDPWGWPVNEYDEAWELRPGLEKIARQVLGALLGLATGKPHHGIGKHKLEGNPAWPDDLAERAGSLPQERFVVLLPLALSRTQDDKGRVRWTLFGGSEQGPARAFWQGFFTAPGREVPEEESLGFVRRLLAGAYGEKPEDLGDLRRAGFRILAQDREPAQPLWREDPLPVWTKPYLWTRGQRLTGVKYLLTFTPFSELPPAVRQAYLAGDLRLLPYPGSLVFWGAPGYHVMRKALPLALQVPLLHVVARSIDPHGIRVPQSGWLHEPAPGKATPGEHFLPIRNTFRRTHRWSRVHRDEDELAIEGREDKLLHVLFSTNPDDMGLYDKPMARNAQLWTPDHELLLDGPNADGEDIKKAAHAVAEGGLFGYRMKFPAMRVGLHEVYWHRPLVAWQPKGQDGPTVLYDAPPGYLTAYRADRLDLARPVTLWPRLLHREPHVAAVTLFAHTHDPRPFQTARNVRYLLQTSQLLGGRPLPRSFARRLLTLAKQESLDDWLGSLPQRAGDGGRGRWLADEVRKRVEPAAAPAPAAKRAPPSLTYGHTSRRSFEVAYWKTIASLAEGRYVNKDNADPVQDLVTEHLLPHPKRDLEVLGDYLLAYYQRVAGKAGMGGKVLVGDLPFTWKTDFDFSWMGGWADNQKGLTQERDLVVVIPGRDRRRAVIMADHYDTAYMADRYEKESGGKGARLSASGADDNHSATAAMMLGAPVFMGLSKAGKLDCDVWLIHLTGEEFPADCLGARHLTECLVEGNLQIRLAKGGKRDLSKVRVQGLYVLDMVGHNNDHDRDVFQLAPGTVPESMWLAYQAHMANEVWNASTQFWNQSPTRQGRGRGRRSPHGGFIPETAEHLALQGEVRTPYNPRSTLYNTDGQIFSDAGVPAVLFMENYDINRTGYHDTHDTMANIDLDYGAAVAAIAIESVARAATEEPMKF